MPYSALGVIGFATFNSSSGAIASLVTGGVVSGVTRVSAGKYRVTLSPAQAAYTMTCTGSDDNLYVMIGYYSGLAANKTTTQFDCVLFGINAGLRDSEIVDITVFGPTSVSLSGPSSVTLTFEDSNSDPVPFVDFTLVGQGYARTNNLGVATFGAVDGSYTVTARTTNGVVFPNTSLTVSGTTAETITGSSPAITPPADPSLCLLYGYLETLDGQPAVGVRLKITLASSTPASSGAILTQSPPVFATSDSSGYFEIELQRNDLMTPADKEYIVECDAIQMKKRISLTTATYDLADEI